LTKTKFDDDGNRILAQYELDLLDMLRKKFSNESVDALGEYWQTEIKKTPGRPSNLTRDVIGALCLLLGAGMLTGFLVDFPQLIFIKMASAALVLAISALCFYAGFYHAGRQSRSGEKFLKFIDVGLLIKKETTPGSLLSGMLTVVFLLIYVFNGVFYLVTGIIMLLSMIFALGQMMQAGKRAKRDLARLGQSKLSVMFAVDSQIEEE